VGEKPFDAMPSYHRAIEVGLTPYRDTDFNRASFPMKTLEYLAAGRGAVSTDLPAVRWLDTHHIKIASDPRSFADAVEHAMTQHRTPQLVEERKNFARTHSWMSRARHFAEVLGIPETIYAESCVTNVSRS
jgi:teichuronic acid biosynthesis glycosyltransferase TuaH